jgi:hypothetical protein
MNPDDFKQTWQTQSSQTRLKIDAELLLKELRRNQRDFTATIFSRDVQVVVTYFLLVLVWIYLGVKLALPWTWYLAIPALLWSSGFFLADLMRHRPKPPEPGESLRQCVENSLAQVEHQIWLHRNSWWYLLPLALAICGHLIVCQIREGWLSVLLMAGWVAMVMIAAAAVFYWAIPIAIRSKLEPRRQELKAMLMSLNDETPAAS